MEPTSAVPFAVPVLELRVVAPTPVVVVVRVVASTPAAVLRVVLRVVVLRGALAASIERGVWSGPSISVAERVGH